MITLRGRWRITVTGREAAWDQRVYITGSDGQDGEHPGIIGHSFTVNGEEPWTLAIEHNDGSGWGESRLQLSSQVVHGTDIHFTVFSEDIVDQPGGDYNDLILEVRKVGPIIDVPIRPYAIRTDNFQMMPDGVFETSLGQYYMGVRVKNIWGADFPADQMLDISQQSRNILASQGIEVIDSWTGSEFQSLGQTMNGRRVVIGPLKQFESRTVFFKVNCINAQPRKHSVELECLRPNNPDLNSPSRRITKMIFVSKCYFDNMTKEMVAECPQGKLRMKLRKVLIDRKSVKRAMKRVARVRPRSPMTEDELRRIYDAIDSGKRIDLCEIWRLFRCYCECRDTGVGKGRFTFDDFFLWPLEFSYTVETPPFSGAYGPLPFDDPWWKLFLLLLALFLYLSSTAEDLAYHDDDIVIGTLEDWKRHDVDAAVCLLNKNRRLPAGIPLHYLDAQTGEFSTVPLEAMDSEIAIPGHILTNQDIDDLYAQGNLKGLKVFKSGARTGLTYGSVLDIVRTPTVRDEDGTQFGKPQIIIQEDPNQPMMISNKGDSGSVWITQEKLGSPKCRRIVALNHSGDRKFNTAWGSRIEDVTEALKIKFS